MEANQDLEDDSSDFENNMMDNDFTPQTFTRRVIEYKIGKSIRRKMKSGRKTSTIVKTYKKYRKKFQEAIRIPEKYIISKDSHFKQNWDYVIILMAFYETVMVPLNISFDFLTNWMLILQHFIDLIFLFDIIIQCCTSVRRRGIESYDSNVIIGAYLFSTRGLFDILAALGSNVLVSLFSKLEVLQIFKCTRISKLGLLI